MSRESKSTQQSKSAKPSAKPATTTPNKSSQSSLSGVITTGSLDQLPPLQRQNAVVEAGRRLGNRQAGSLVSRLQRHHENSPSNLTEEQQGMVDNMAQLMRKANGNSVMRAVHLPDTTQQATVNAAAAPLNLMETEDAAAPVVSALAANTRLRILSQSGTNSRVHVEVGPNAGQLGFVPTASVTVTANPTSIRTPAAGPENAYTQLATELALAAPNKNTIFDIIEFRLTHPQQAQLLTPGNAEYAALQATRAINANDLLHICNIIGMPLQRKITDYLAKRGSTARELRLAFATANDQERLDVARDDALIGRLRPILGTVHPEIVFGTAISVIYPADGNVNTLRGTNPNLARWLRNFVNSSQDLNALAQTRASGIQGALATLNAQPPATARAEVMSAIRAAARGLALPDAERTALDAIEERAYQEGIFTSNDLAIMFVTRWGRPFRNAFRMPKTFIHQIWSALEPLPLEHVLLNNVLRYFDENQDPTAAGSFTDWLGSGNFGQLLSDRPTNNTTFTAAGAQNSTRINVNEPQVDMLSVGDPVAVTQQDSTVVNTTVRAVSVTNKWIRFAARVDVADAGQIQPGSANQRNQGDAMRITAPVIMYANNAGAPDLTTVVGNLQPGNLFSKARDTTIAGVKYMAGWVENGQFANQICWLDESKATGLGVDAGTEEFAWTIRHEMGHSLDLQLNGFSQFSQPSAAQWTKYPNRTDWLADLVNTAAIPTPNTNVVHNGVNSNFNQAAGIYAQAVQDNNAGSANALLCQQWLQGWQAAGGSMNVYNAVTQFNANANYYNNGNLGIPALGGRIFGAHYGEWFSANNQARSQSLAVGVPPYAYTCSYEFFADHYAAYTGPGTGGDRYARAVPGWALNFFDRLVGAADAGPEVGMERQRMGP